MARTDRSRRSRRPEHSDGAPRFQHRPVARRQRTRKQAVLMAVKEAW